MAKNHRKQKEELVHQVKSQVKQMENTKVNTDKSKAKKVVLLSLGTLTVSVLTFLGIKSIKKSKSKNNDDTNQTPDPADFKVPVQSGTNRPANPRLPSGSNAAAFPIRLGAKGDKVIALQHALIRTYGSGIFPKYGADGIFGSELEGFLRAKGYKIPLSEEDFKKITQTKTQASAISLFDPTAIAKGIFNAITTKDFKSAIMLLKAIGNTNNYRLVSEKFQHYRIGGGVRQTLVNGMLRAFSEKSQKEETQSVFLKMGLKFNAATGQWSLSGF
jgi:hypothetical protein